MKLVIQESVLQYRLQIEGVSILEVIRVLLGPNPRVLGSKGLVVWDPTSYPHPKP